ncbi:S8 family serine peptidase [Domibacillus sp. PGB-M46]|uniref:S8 family serine peptidase n=1 Tax=Domibacillus sp. PGB-M46 TaxID=2910255 RepID=UPI001F5934C4|nr:S8 family serine peptidase [Domibacillus sp. PGB-M46]MCI2253881.1 S8 family serine peptidase [Domibacillus sp. PGB-M46]
MVKRIIALVLSIPLLLINVSLPSSKAEIPDLQAVIEKEKATAAVKQKQILVLYDEKVSRIKKKNIRSSVSSSVSSLKAISPTTDVLTLSNQKHISQVVKELKKEKHIKAVEANTILRSVYSTNDAMLQEQWWIRAIEAPKAWLHKDAQKKDVVVAVIDSGVNLNHEDLKNQIVPGAYDFYNETSEINDLTGHGTMVAGTVAAQTNNEIGIAGSAGEFNVKILPIRASDYEGSFYLTDTVQAINYAVEQNADIINLSLGGSNYSAIENAAIQRAVEAGIIVVAAAGNGADEGNAVSYPASYENVISVGAVDSNKERSFFSTHNQYVDVAAPGSAILTTSSDGKYETADGTSFASPITAGILAMAKSIYPALSSEDAVKLIRASTEDLGPAGFDNEYGYGLINAELAVKNALDYAAPKHVTGLSLDKQQIYLNLDVHANQEILKTALNSPTKPEGALIKSQPLKNNVYYEEEPNNEQATANTISAAGTAFGSITETFDDTDYYRFTIEENGLFVLTGGWTSENTVGKGWEEDLAFDLFTEDLSPVTYSYHSGPEDSFQYLGYPLEAGTYYLTAYQLSDYQHLYTDEWYQFSTEMLYEKPAAALTMLTKKLFMKKGEMTQAEAVLTPTDEEHNFEWSSSNPAVAAVDDKGLIFAQNAGKAIITASWNGQTVSSVVKITAETKKPTEALFETILPENADNQTLQWSSSNPKVASVDSNGIVTGVSSGTAVIKAVTEDGGFTASTNVNVTGTLPPIIWTDFEAQNVDKTKTFTITFNYEIDPASLDTNSIFAASDPSGIHLIDSFTASVNPANKKQVLVSPKTEWDTGDYYLFIKDKIKSTNGKVHKNLVRMKFIVK